MSGAVRCLGHENEVFRHIFISLIVMGENTDKLLVIHYFCDFLCLNVSV